MTGALTIQLRKEARALLPWWLCVAVLMVAAALIAHRYAGEWPAWRDVQLLAATVYVLGVLALGALSIGHELTHGTLPALLVQPSSRVRMLLVKLAVLAPAVVLLALVADWATVRCCAARQVRLPRFLVLWAPVAMSVGLVPLLTLLSRKPLGGVVFAIAAYGMVSTVSEWMFPLRESTLSWWLTWYVMLALSGAGLVFLVSRFRQLEAGGDVRSSSRDRAVVAADRRRAKPRNWIWLAVKKEVRLQFLTLCVSALYLLVCAAILLAQRFDPNYMGPTFYSVTLLHAGAVALLAGAMSSAEERHLGTLASQVLMPRASWRQWTVKLAVAQGLTMALAAGLPAMLATSLPPSDRVVLEAEFLGGLALATGAAMYVSSVSSNSLWALLASLPAIVLSLFLTEGLLRTAMRTVPAWIPVDYRRVAGVLNQEYQTDAWSARREELQWIRWLETDALAWVVAGVLVLGLYFAARNHRSLDRSARMVASQVAVLLLVFWAGTIACLVIARISYGAIR